MASFRAMKDARANRQKGSAAYGPSGSASAAAGLSSTLSSSATEVTDQAVLSQRTDASGVAAAEQRPSADEPDIEVGVIDEASQALYALELDPAGLIVREIAKRGRGLVAKRHFKAGNRIVRTDPAASILSLENLPTICSGCFLTPQERTTLQSSLVSPDHTTHIAEGTAGLNEGRAGKRQRLNRCSGCKTLHYCSRECQLSDWPSHKTECQALRRLRSMYLGTYPGRAKDEEDVRWAGHEAIRAMGRMCWRRKDERVKNGGKDGIWWEKIASLESHIKQLPESEIMKHAQQVQHLRHYISAGVPLKPGEDGDKLEPADMKQFGFEGIGELLDFVSSFKVNSFTLSSPSLTPIGVSTSPLVALSNHSCDPNAVVVFPKGGQGMEIIAIADIAPGEEILTSYIDVTTPYSSRQAELLDRYRFQCDCTLCQKSQGKTGSGWVDPRWCVKHVGCERDGKGNMPDIASSHTASAITCDTCEQTFTLEVKTLSTLIQRGKEMLRQDESGSLDPVQARKTLPPLLAALQAILPASSHPLLPLLRLSVLILAPPENVVELNLIIEHISLAYEGSVKVLPQYHPTIAVILSEWGKLSSLEFESELGDGDNRQSQSQSQLQGEVGSKQLISGSRQGGQQPDGRKVGIQDREKQTQIRKQRERHVLVTQQLRRSIEILRKAVSACERGFGGDGGITGIEMRGLLRGCEGELALYGGQRV